MMRQKRPFAWGCVIVTGLTAISVQASDPQAPEKFRLRAQARLISLREVPAIISPGIGSFAAGVNKDGSMISYRLSYRSSGVVQAAHIHVGQPGVNGGVAAFLCGGDGGAPACPPSPGMVEGMLMAENIVGPEGQGIAPEELGKLIAAMVAGVAYVNVHTDLYPSGELRGQIETRPRSNARWQEPAEDDDDSDSDADSDSDTDDEDEDDDFDDDDDDEDSEAEYRRARPRR